MKKLLLPALMLLLLNVPATARAGSTSSSSPLPGTIEWVNRLATVSAQIEEEIPDSRTLVERYQPLLLLYQGCDPCLAQTYRQLEHLLKNKYRDPEALLAIQEREFAEDPVKLGRLYVAADRLAEAERLVSKALPNARFVEQRLDLVEILAAAHQARGDLLAAQKLVTRLLSEFPIASDYCDRTLQWWSWLGEEPVPQEETSIDMRGFLAKFAKLQEMERTRGNTPYVSCLYSHHLLSLERWTRGTKSVGSVVPPEVEALFPQGIDQQLLELARRTPDPKTRAAILILAASRETIADRARGLSLAREAGGVGGDSTIQTGALWMEIRFTPLDSPEDRKGRADLSLRLIRQFSEYATSCDGCASYWDSLCYPWPEFINRIGEWRHQCAELLNKCPDSTRRWHEVASAFPSAHARAREVFKSLLASGPPEQVVPEILLKLSTAVRSTEPERAWRMERQAIRHPAYPGLYRPEIRGENAFHAEQHGDFETAFFVSLLPRPGPHIGGCIPGAPAPPDPDGFLLAYYRLRMGINPVDNWLAMLSRLPMTPDGDNARFFHRREYLDRLEAAAIATHRAEAGLAWFQEVRRNYREWSRRAAPPGESGRSQSARREIEKLLDGYIARLGSSLTQDAPI